MATTLSASPNFQAPPATPIQGWSNSFVNIANDQGVPLYAQASYLTNVKADGSVNMSLSKQTKDVVNRLKVSVHQNVYEADFEYGAQPLRWENVTTGSGIIKQIPQLGGVQMTISNPGDVTVRQSRPYHRYQPGKTMYMATNVNFGGPNAGQAQRVGFFDDSNGIFFEQGTPTTGNPAGMSVVVRSDVNGLPIDTRIDYTQWSDPFGVKSSLNWSQVQMLWLEYAWYGAGCLRWGVLINGEAFVLHEYGTANTIAVPWARTGNLPVRYEQRNYSSNAIQVFNHYGVSVIVEGGRDPQRGFTYSYSVSAPTQINSTFAKPVLSIRNRTMGTRVVDTYQTYTANGVPIPGGYNLTYSTGTSAITGVSTINGLGSPVILNFAPNTWPTSLSGLSIYFPTVTGVGYPSGVTGRIYANTSSSITAVDVVMGLSAYGTGSSSGVIPNPLSGITVSTHQSVVAVTTTGVTFITAFSGVPYQIGLINRGQILPLDLLLSTNQQALLQFYVSTPYNPIILNNPQWRSMASLSSYNSFAEVDQSATSFTGGEIVYSFYVSPGFNVQDKDLSNFFPLYNTIRGNTPDILTLAINTFGQPLTAGANIIGQEAMS